MILDISSTYRQLRKYVTIFISFCDPMYSLSNVHGFNEILILSFATDSCTLDTRNLELHIVSPPLTCPLLSTDGFLSQPVPHPGSNPGCYEGEQEVHIYPCCLHTDEDLGDCTVFSIHQYWRISAETHAVVDYFACKY